MGTNYVEALYLLEHQPAPSAYVSPYKSRLPPHCKEIPQYCECGRSLNEQSICTFCQEAEVVLNCPKAMELDEKILAILKPLQCGICQSQVKSHHALHNWVTGAERALHPCPIHPK